MKEIFKISEEEKNRILNLHESATSRHYLSEQLQSVVSAPNFDTTRTPESISSKIKEVQNALIFNGYSVGPSGADGKMGSNTRKAILKYQKDKGIKQTGVVGPITAKSLKVEPLTQSKKSTLQTKVDPLTKKTTSIDSKKSSDTLKGEFFTCVKDSPKKKVTVSKNGSSIILIDNHYFFSKGRVKLPNGKMGNYFCYRNGVKIKDSQDKETYVETGVKTNREKTSRFSGGIVGFFRKTFPNVAQIFDTKPLTGKDFTESQKQVVFNVIQNAINQRKQSRTKGCTEYIDYSPDIDQKLNKKGGATTAEMILGSGFSDEFRVATLLGRFCYELQPDGSYNVKDDYDFHKWATFTVKKNEVEGMSYPEKIGYIRDKTGLSPYGAIRHIGWLENPSDAPEATKTKIVLNINSGYFANLDKKGKPSVDSVDEPLVA